MAPAPYTSAMAITLTSVAPPGAVERVRTWFTERPRMADAALSVALMVVLGWMIQAEQGGFRVPDTLAYVCAFALGALLMLRRSFPLLVLFLSLVILLAYSSLGYPNIGLGIPLAPALYSAAERHRLRWPVTIVGLLLFLIFAAGLAAAYVRETDTHLLSLFIYTLAPEIALMAAVIALGDSLRSRRELAERSARVIEATAQQERALAQAVAATERADIARELHDTLGHQTTVISMHTDVAAEALPHKPEAAQRALSVIADTSRQMMSQLRDTVQTLREHEVRPPLLSIRALETTVFANSPLEIDADIAVPHQYQHNVEAAAYRIVQEALTNTAKHSTAGTVQVQIRPQGSSLEVKVCDPGPPRGQLGSISSGMGILGMKERVAALGGTLEAGPKDLGFQVRALLPVSAESWQKEAAPA
ncbi:sensor histidine kinase [Nesterenkonia alkaliphila]|uniref:histidine kinase n=2 Tax=Nesterenkonia alkaliphila TaxID=1463631 RepID=A0A7K1UJ84_9MICC|nr:sensor histidine kinase [Nesterenkonia alkaliphila]GFZ95181.1 two-component sensor histidine kinase [Nesterenkonia alkaliphila]